MKSISNNIEKSPKPNLVGSPEKIDKNILILQNEKI